MNYVLDVISFVKVNKELIMRNIKLSCSPASFKVGRSSKVRSGTKSVRNLLGIVFTCNDLDLFRWVYSMFEELKEPDFWSASMALTTSGNKHSVRSFKSENGDDTCSPHRFKIQVGRMNFAKVFAEDFKVHEYENKVHVYLAVDP